MVIQDAALPEPPAASSCCLSEKVEKASGVVLLEGADIRFYTGSICRDLYSSRLNRGPEKKRTNTISFCELPLLTQAKLQFK